MNSYKVIVKGLVQNTKGEILILQRAGDDPVDPLVWETVGGKVDQGESLEEALKREVYEESGLDIEVHEVLYALTLNLDFPAVLIAYKCTTASEDVLLSDEHIDYKWVSKTSLESHISEVIYLDLIKHKVMEKL